VLRPELPFFSPGHLNFSFRALGRNYTLVTEPNPQHDFHTQGKVEEVALALCARVENGEPTLQPHLWRRATFLFLPLCASFPSGVLLLFFF